MAIALFDHNRIAYEATVALLNETGKSFIAFKLCEDNPDKRIC